MLLTSRFSKVNHTKKHSAQRQNSTNDCKNCGKSHFKSFKHLNSFFKSLSKMAIIQSIVTMPNRVKYICQRAKSLKLTTIYANIPNKAVKKANKKVLKNSIFIFTFSSSIKSILPHFNKFNSTQRINYV
ncbi:hypothetical protein CHELV3228_a0031 (plasmid) [Campylobacter helveticus]|nr:hypothetical protein CHELV3228_a0031 [Campylobacter helveticus]SMC22326.1 hypothetical protein SAMN02745125_01373 [Campylobacter helveticus]SUW87730.1 Uncharacterised protein [Campylobacter helveticus]